MARWGGREAGALPNSHSQITNKLEHLFCIFFWSPGGIIFVSLYLFSGEGVSERNVNLIARVAEWLFRLGRPYIWAADWQNLLEQIGEVGVIQQLRGTLCAPERSTRGTCAPAGRVIDFFIVHSAVLPLLGIIQVLYDVPTRPHWLVLLRFSAGRAALGRWRIAKPPPYPVAPPLGCEQEPNSSEARQVADSWGKRRRPRKGQVEPLVLRWYAGANAELATCFYDSPKNVGSVGLVSRVVWYIGATGKVWGIVRQATSGRHSGRFSTCASVSL